MSYPSSSRPRQPLIVKCTFNNAHRRITFPSASTCKVQALRARIEDCFQLSLSPFSVNYTDDDGESTSIRSESDLTEAIAYFAGGDEWDATVGGSNASVSGYAPSYGVGAGGGGSTNGDGHDGPAPDPVSLAYGSASRGGKGKITLRVHVEVEYDGPSLSDNGSVHDGQSERSSVWDDDVDEDEYASTSGGSSSMLSGSSGRSGSSHGRDGHGSGSRAEVDRLRAAQRIRAQQVRDETIFEETEDEDEDAGTEYGSRLGSRAGERSRGIADDEDARGLEEDEDFSQYPEDGLVEADIDDYGDDERGWERSQDLGDNTRQPWREQADNRSNGSYARHRTSSHSGQGANGNGMGTRRDAAREEYAPRRPSQSYTDTSSALTSSELGARWLREQTERIRKKTGTRSNSSEVSFESGRMSRSAQRSDRGSRNGSRYNTQTEEDEEETALVDEARGELELVQNDNGRWYYSYQISDNASMRSNGLGDGVNHYDSLPDMRAESSAVAMGKRPDQNRASSEPLELGSSWTPGQTEMDRLVSSLDEVAFEEAAAPPALAPDCSSCGIRLEYIRYVCKICGEGHFKMDGHPHVGPVEDVFEEWPSPHPQPPVPTRPILPPIETALADALEDHWRDDAVSPSSSLGSDSAATARNPFQDFGPSDSVARLITPPTRASSSSSGSTATATIEGFELCPGCIEEQGIAHARAMLTKTQGAATLALMVQETDEMPRTVQKRLNTIAHTYREMIWGARGWKDIEYNDECHCSICNVALYQNRFKCISCPNFNLCRSCHRNAQEIHPAHCFLSVPDQAKRVEAIAKANGALKAISAPTSVMPVIKHPGAFCHNCLQDIVGSRFHCAVCPSWDLCQDCEGVTSHVSGTGSHTADHIMMKIPLPLPTSEIEHVSRQARERWAQQDSSVVAAAGEILGADRPASYVADYLDRARPSSPTNETVYAGAAPRRNGRAVGVRDSMDHGVQCKGCSEWMMGKRYQCANCPSEPVPFNLCSACEGRSHQLHNPFHVFIKFDRPVHYPLQSPFMILPVLYKKPVGDVGPGVRLISSDPEDYLKHVVHPATICDIHVGPIQGVWLRCAHCAVSFDVCALCEEAADHDPGHVFVVFKSEVDMPTFRALTALSSNHYRPLIAQHVYL